MNEPRAIDPQVPCRTLLTGLPARVLHFLQVIATHRSIYAAMVQGGYGAKDHAEGWALLGAVCALRDACPNMPAYLSAQAALADIHQWVATHFARLRVALERLHPSHSGLFLVVDSRAPAESLFALAQLIDQVRNGSAAHDAALLATLARRGLDQTEIERLSQLIAQAQSVTDPTDAEADLDARTDELTALYQWYRDWAETARRLIKRKDYRIALGLATKQGAGTAAA